MGKKQRQIKLGAFLFPTGHHVAAWRHPEAEADGGHNFAHYRHLAQIAERGRFDMLFLADNVAARQDGNPKVLSRLGQTLHFEPLTLLSALAAITEHIGLAATASTTYNEPYHVARKFASLDYLSDGRAAWNVVTSASDIEAKNFNREVHMEHPLRYEHAREFVDVVTGLWDSWEDDAFLRDKASGIYVDPEKLHVLNHMASTSCHLTCRGDWRSSLTR